MKRYLVPLLPALLFLLTAQSRPASSTSPAPRDSYALSAEDFFKRPETQARITATQADIPLLEAAIFHESNRRRAQAKLPLFKYSKALNLMARRHSAEMADLQFFDHTSPTPANRTLGDRLRNVGLANVVAGENIAVLPAKEMGSGHYIVTDNPDGTETWTDAQTHKVINYYTYAELAAAVLTQWMNSPAHRENMLDARYVYLGVGVARGPYDHGQDSFYMTQNFSSKITPASEAKAATLLAPTPSSPPPTAGK